MDKNKEQKLLLEIVETWRPSEYPEYREFKCANCQEYKNQAWYHWLNLRGYRLPIHMCDKCEPELKKGTIKIDQSKRQIVDRSSFGKEYKFQDKTIQRFKKIVSTWPDYEEPRLKTFICDECGQDLDIDPLDKQRKGFHVWWKKDDGKTLVELHFHKFCGNSLGVYSRQEEKLS
ncbi:MAG: hypothetical protein HYT06_01520 [Candidatus Levybacteria bacterium]|nr:hypothetical protein [Candidatus Levybacteria bacterium]